MRRILWTVALCVAATGAFAQKKAVKEAQSIIHTDTEEVLKLKRIYKEIGL